MDIISILTLLSALVGLIGFFFPVEWKKKIYVKIIFIIILGVLSSLIVFQNSKIQKVENISKSANLLVEGKDMDFTHEGFILASLSFLEQNKAIFPDSYKRAQEIFEIYNKSENRSIDSVGTSSEMEGLIKGIGILSTIK